MIVQCQKRYYTTCQLKAPDISPQFSDKIDSEDRCGGKHQVRSFTAHCLRKQEGDSGQKGKLGGPQLAAMHQNGVETKPL